MITRRSGRSIGVAPPYPWSLPDEVEQLVLAHGFEQVGTPVGGRWKRRRAQTAGLCYEQAGRWALRDDEVTYTEGKALGLSADWLPHAWLTAADGSMVDLAWEEPGSRYQGIPIPTELLAEAILGTGMFGPVLPLLAQQGWTPPR